MEIKDVKINRLKLMFYLLTFATLIINFFIMLVIKDYVLFCFVVIIMLLNAVAFSYYVKINEINNFFILVTETGKVHVVNNFEMHFDTMLYYNCRKIRFRVYHYDGKRVKELDLI